MARRLVPSLSVTDDNLISSGIQLDRHTLKRAMWESAAGVVFADGVIRRERPTSLAFSMGTGTPVRGLQQQYDSLGGRWLWAASGSKISRWQFGAPEVIDAAFGTYHADTGATFRPTIYDFTPYGDWMIINNGEPGEHAKIRKSDVSYGPFAAGQAPDGVLKYLKLLSFVVAIGHGTRGTQVSNSDANNVELWVAAADNTASSLAIDEFNTPIRAGDRLGDAISVYSEDQIALVRYIGAPFILGQKTTIDGIGAIGKAAVASDGQTNVGVSRAGCWWTDGITSRYIDEGWIAQYLQDNVNWDQGAKIAVARNDYNGTFEFSFPMGSSLVLNETWAWDPKTGGWGPCSYVFSIMDERRLFNYPVKGLVNGEVHLSDFDNEATQVDLSLVTKPLLMRDPNQNSSPHAVYRIDELDLLLHKAEQIEFRVGCCSEPDGLYDWTEWMEAEPGARVNELSELPENTFFKLALRSAPDRADWELNFQGFVLYGTPVGSKM